MSTATESKKPVLTIKEIKEIIPHRYPFLLVDRVDELVPGERISCTKNTTVNEEFYNGHFPDQPVMPGVLQLEAMAQAGAILAAKSAAISPDKKMFLAGATDVKWKRPVVPGDVLTIKMSFVKARRPFFVLQGEIYVDGQLASQATITAAEV